MVKLGHHETLKLYNCLNIRDVSFTVYAKLGLRHFLVITNLKLRNKNLTIKETNFRINLAG